MRAFLRFDVLQNHLERLQIGVDIGYNGKLHSYLYLRNFKPAKLICRVAQSTCFIPDKMSQPRFANRLLEGFQFLPRPSAINSTRPSGRLRTVPVTSKPAATVLTV